MILMIDNFDSFTYNLVQYLEMLDEKVLVKRNNEIDIEGIASLQPSILVISPGPGNPKTAGISMEVIEHFKGKIPILGICLGHQSIGEYFGAKIVKGPCPVHGKVFSITHDKKGVFKALPSPLDVTRYHSLVVDEESLPSCLEVTARTEDGLIMGLRHREFLIEGVQFHPEAILTQYGLEMLRNFVMEAKNANKRDYNR